MKRASICYIVILSLLSLHGCQSTDNKKALVTEAMKDVDTVRRDALLAGHPIQFYLDHKGIPQVCKDLFNGVRQPSDDDDVLALLDSVLTSNNDTSPFYFFTITRTMEKADGAYAEPLGMMAKRFVETRTKEFVDYFRNEALLTDKDIEEWAKSVAGEIMTVAEGKEKEELDNLNSKLRFNCEGCIGSQIEVIEEFSGQVDRSLQGYLQAGKK